MSVTVRVELYLSPSDGIFDPAYFDPAIFDTGSPWIDVHDHVLIGDGMRWSKGIFDQGPLACVARPGVFTFNLDNEPPGLPLGYYTPGNPNCRAGFRHGTPVRIRLSDGVSTIRYVWRGVIRIITPEPGSYGGRKTACMAVDWMARLAEADASGLDLLEDVRVEDGIAAVVALTEVPPALTDYDTGVYLMPFVFDDLGGDSPKAMSVAQRLVQTEGGFLYVRGDATEGETLRLENGQARAVRASVASFTGADILFAPDGIVVPSSLDRVFNFLETVTYPRRVDEDNNVVLVQLDAPIEVGDGETVRIFADYRDPEQLAEFVGAKQMQQPNGGYGSPAGSPGEPLDYSANAFEDGTGADVTVDVGISATYFGSRAMFEITNHSGATAWVRGPLGSGSPPTSTPGMQARGRGLYRYAPIITQGENVDSIAAYGLQELGEPLELFYQNERSVGQDRADLVAFLYGGLTNVPTRVRILTEREDLETHGILRDVGDKITVSEEVTVPDMADVFIQGVEQEFTVDGYLLTWWTLGPADTSAALIFDDPEFGKFDERVFAYG